MTHDNSVPCLYEMEPIGVDGKLEAVATLWFCSDRCRRVYETDQTVESGENSEYLDGTLCEECGIPVVTKIGRTGEESNYYVDIPTADCIGNPDGAYKNVGLFKTKADAIAFAREHFGADENGNVCLVTG